MNNDTIIDIIGQAQTLVAKGDQDKAQELYNSSWNEAVISKDHYQQCIIAHFMAHAQTSPEVQLMWHLRSLESAEIINDERVQSFYPSLYANIAEVFLRLGNIPQAKLYVEKAQSVEPVLPDDTYGYMIRSLITRITQALTSIPS
jgi:hypothetical protein